MPSHEHDPLRSLLRKVDEVRGLGSSASPSRTISLEDPDQLVHTLGELVEELERAHRRLIETNVQLVSLREVASRLAETVDIGETTGTVTRYLQRAFGFDQVGLLLIDREQGVLTGSWTVVQGDSDSTHALDVPLVGERGALARAVWLSRTLLHHDCQRHVPASVQEAHPLMDAFSRLGSLACVPLVRSQPAASDEEGVSCDAACALGHSRILAPPPGDAASRWSAEREDVQRRCLSCRHLPTLGVLAMARSAGAPQLGAADLTLIESVALSLAPMIENARLLQELRRSQRFQQHVLDSMASALVAVNLRGEVLSLNRAGEELLGWSEEDVLGDPVGSLMGQEGEELLDEAMARGREVARQETLLRRRDGEALPVRLSTSRLRDEDGRVYGALATFLDLTPIKRAEEHARQMDRLAALGRFTSSVAHEIRNPLTGIGMGVQHLARALAGDERQSQNLDFIHSEIKRLDRIVQDLFDVTHPRQLDLAPRPLTETLSRARQSVAHLVEPRGIEWSLVAPADLPSVPHDPDQMQQVFINLIKNAAEASPEGGTLTVTLEPAHTRRREGAEPAVLVHVRDEGTGIDAETCRTLFEPFFTTKPGGTGLGLYISHDIVKRHGGSLTVRSEPGRGATFTVELPLAHHGGIR